MYLSPCSCYWCSYIHSWLTRFSARIPASSQSGKVVLLSKFVKAKAPYQPKDKQHWKNSQNTESNSLALASLQGSEHIISLPWDRALETRPVWLCWMNNYWACVRVCGELVEGAYAARRATIRMDAGAIYKITYVIVFLSLLSVGLIGFWPNHLLQCACL